MIKIVRFPRTEEWMMGGKAYMIKINNKPLLYEQAKKIGLFKGTIEPWVKGTPFDYRYKMDAKKDVKRLKEVV